MKSGQKLAIIVVETLLYIHKACIVNGYTPSPWSNSHTIFIHKMGKSNYSDSE
jgi:hypothetical protein